MIPGLLLYKIMQLFAIMILGFLIVKFKIVKSSDSLILSKISLYLLMPASILSAFDIELTGDVAKGFILALAVAVGLHLVFLAIDLAFSRICKATSVERASVMYSNAGNLIFPIVSFVLGGEWVIYSCAFLIVQLAFLWTHGVNLFSEDKKFHFKKIITNVNLLTIALGLVLLLCRVRLPAFVSEVTSSVGGMLGTVGMLIAGMTMASVDLIRVIKNARLYLVLIMRMIFTPAVTLILLRLLLLVINIENAESILLISFLACITPSAATVMQFAQIHNKDSELAVSVNVASALISIVTMPLFVWLYFL